MSNKRSRISPTTAAVMLAAMVGGLGTAPNASIPRPETNKVQAETPQNSGTRSTPTNSQSQGRVVAEAGDDPRKRRRYLRLNQQRQARKILEEIGYVKSGRHWVHFRKFARTSPLGAQIMKLAMQRAAERMGIA